MTSMGALFFRSSRFPCIKRLEACLWSYSIQIRWCCAGPRVGLAQLAFLSHLADSRSKPYDSEGRSARSLDAITAPMASSKKYAM